MNRSLFFVMLILLTSLACSRKEASVAAAGVQTAAASGKVETIALSEIVDTYHAAGTVQARESAAIAARILAGITEVHVRAGDQVQAGQVLVTLDRRDLDANFRRSQAAQAEAASAISEAEQLVAGANASVELAGVTHRRIEDLLGKTSVSQQEADESRARLKSVSASLNIAASKRRQAEARLQQTEAEVANARVALGYATLLAPFAGLVTERKADPGTLATPGTPLLILERESSLLLEAAIDESRLGHVRTGQLVTLMIHGLDRTATGYVSEIVPSVDAATRSFIAKIGLPALPGLRAGMFGRAEFAVRKREALLIPRNAVVSRGQVRSVYVVEGGIVRLRLVTLGREFDGDRQEVLAGLSTGERIVLEPSSLLSDGQPISVQELLQ